MARKILFLSFLILFLIASSAVAFQLPDTGQTKCYRDVSPYDEIPCAGTGQDGAYNINPMSYTDNGNGTVTDNNTGLTWQKQDDGATHNWYQASGTYHASYNPSSQDVCGSLNLGGYSDWRLPAKKELITIVDYSIPYPGTTINTAYFPNTKSASYWSSTTFAYNPSLAWDIYFGWGFVGYSLGKDYGYYVRCVRGGQSSPSFTDNGNGTVIDNKTGLVWQKGEPGYMTWGSALSYCKGLSLGGKTDWRLPNIKELESITDDTRYYPAIDTTFFPGVYAVVYWSSTTYATFPDVVWYVNFYHGNVSGYSKDGISGVGCVRGGQSGSFGLFDHFDISSVSSPQSVNTPFSVTITAKDVDEYVVSNWTGWVTLSSNIGSLNITQVYLSTNGTATTNISIDSVGINARIRAIGAGKSGVSNYFNVTGANVNNGFIGGIVHDSSDNKLTGAVVYLDDGVNPVLNQSTVNGKYQFTSIPCGAYDIHASYNVTDSRTYNVSISCNTSVTLDLLVATCNPNNTLTPILLVPGIMGSSTGGGLYPTLSKDYLDVDSSEWVKKSWGLHDPFKKAGWRDLVESLKTVDANYEIDCTVFPVPYDWRKEVYDAAKDYLKIRIDEAKTKAGTNKVNIIAHSMGGLVTRSYIQGSSYDNDIDRFAMVGTPNHGAANAYYLWAGGDPKLADDLNEGIGCLDLDIYSNTVDMLYDSMTGDPLYGTKLIYIFFNPCGPSGWQYVKDFDNPKYDPKARQFIRDEIKPSEQLLPTYPFLDDGTQCYGITYNNWLINLNNDISIDIMGKENDTSGKIKTKIFAGDGVINYWPDINTIYLINVGQPNALYVDGTPIGRPDFVTSGDGTVLTSSADLSVATLAPQQPGKHAYLIDVYKDDIIEFITGTRPSLTKMRAQALQASQTQNTFTLSLFGRVSPYITDPLGRKSGINPNTNLMEDGIPDSTISINTDSGLISIDNISDGVYTVELKGNRSEDYKLLLSYMDVNGAVQYEFRGFNHANTTSFTITVNSGSVEKITVNHTPLPPAGLQADAVLSGSLMTQLTWTASPDPSVTGYNIYSKYDDEPYLTQIGSSIVNAYDTGHFWASDSSIKTRIYAVSAVKADGTESFLSGMVKNNDRDHDGLTDEEETALGTNVSNPDSDGDGLNDSEEYVRGTDPLLADTDGDGYSDYIEVRAGSDPLDGNSTPPIPDIKANGSDVPLTITSSQSLKLTIALDDGSMSGANADWWVLCDTSMFGWYHYDLSSWVPGIVVTYQPPLFDLGTYQVMDYVLPAGNYTCYFGVDTVVNGVVDMGPGQ
ncbi:MAG: DUF1566 domain-containing protein, partial [Nitrospirae bacterium]|nr:DUF1566 domain-containing protein [Nitrospirota bacterium]